MTPETDGESPGSSRPCESERATSDTDRLSPEVADAVLCPARLNRPVIGPTRIRTQPEDFVVEEIPAYELTGSGEHLFLWVEKRNISTGAMVEELARALRIRTRDAGVAGQKDRRAVTRQFVSVPRTAEANLADVAGDRFRILSVTAHRNKLRTGHLRGNRFRIVLRSAMEHPFSRQDAELADEKLKALSATGFPNYFGPQRFGRMASTLRDGLAVVLKRSSGPRLRHHQRRFVVSAAQSAVFNLVVAARVAEQTLCTPDSGDVVCRRDGIRPFLFDDRGDIAPQELLPMGPMPGRKMLSASGRVIQQEIAAAARIGLNLSDFDSLAKLAPGARRKMAAFPENAMARLMTDGGIEAAFTLPSGSYATVLLAEVCDMVEWDAAASDVSQTADGFP